MPSSEKSPSEIKFSEWRPIGVCDAGAWNERKAVMFNAKELSLVQAAGVGRHNWQQSPKIKKLIHRYARKVAKISSLTQSMIRPDVAEIKLVGMVLHYHKTPTLNMESEAGRVQMFQIGFVDRGKRKLWWGKLLAMVLVALLLVVAVAFLQDMIFQKPQQRMTEMCAPRRTDPLYAQHLNQVQGQIEVHVSRFSPSFGHRCYFAPGSVASLEEQVVRCVLSLKTAPSLQSEGAAFQKINQCVSNICRKEIPALRPSCQKLNF